MTAKQQKESLQNTLRTFKLPEKYIIYQADGRLGKKFAIAVETEHGGIDTKTRFYTYQEMNMYLSGYQRALTNPFDQNQQFNVRFSHSNHNLVKDVYASDEDAAISLAKDTDYWPIGYPNYTMMSIQIFYEDELIIEYMIGLEGELIKQ